MHYQIRRAVPADTDPIWMVIQAGIARRKKDGSTQWQDGYPNPDVIKADIEKGVGFVMTDGEKIIGYIVILINDEPAYADIEGQWLSNGDFVALHRISLAEGYAGIGLSGKLLQFAEDYAKARNIFSIKSDTNEDNHAMARMFEKLGYVYCGTVFVNNGIRRGYEKSIK